MYRRIILDCYDLIELLDDCLGRPIAPIRNELDAVDLLANHLSFLFLNDLERADCLFQALRTATGNAHRASHLRDLIHDHCCQIISQLMLTECEQVTNLNLEGTGDLTFTIFNNPLEVAQEAE